MANAWFRLYSEFADDPKVQMLPEAMQRRLVMLMCSRCKGETLQEQELAFHWRVSETDVQETKRIFVSKGFIDEAWNLVNWNKRQFISDSSTERVRKHRRALERNETLHETNETVTVTPPEQIQIQNRTEQNRETPASTAAEVPAEKDTQSVSSATPKEKHPDLLIYEQYPRKIGRTAALAAIAKAVRSMRGRMEPREARIKLYRAVQQYAKSPEGSNPNQEFIPHPATWFNKGRYDDDPSQWNRGAPLVAQPPPKRPNILDEIRRQNAEADARKEAKNEQAV